MHILAFNIFFWGFLSSFQILNDKILVIIMEISIFRLNHYLHYSINKTLAVKHSFSLSLHSHNRTITAPNQGRLHKNIPMNNCFTKTYSHMKSSLSSLIGNLLLKIYSFCSGKSLLNYCFRNLM